MKRLLNSAKFWTAVIAAVALIGSKLQWGLTEAELTIIAAPFIAVIGAFAAEDAAQKKAGK